MWRIQEVGYRNLGFPGFPAGQPENPNFASNPTHRPHQKCLYSPNLTYPIIVSCPPQVRDGPSKDASSYRHTSFKGRKIWELPFGDTHVDRGQIDIASEIGSFDLINRSSSFTMSLRMCIYLGYLNQIVASLPYLNIFFLKPFLEHCSKRLWNCPQFTF